jgi:hypothetical protein
VGHAQSGYFILDGKKKCLILDSITSYVVFANVSQTKLNTFFSKERKKYGLGKRVRRAKKKKKKKRGGEKWLLGPLQDWGYMSVLEYLPVMHETQAWSPVPHRCGSTHL